MPKSRSAKPARRRSSSSGSKASRPESAVVSNETRRSFQMLSDAHTRMSDRVVLLSKLIHLFTDAGNTERNMERIVDLAMEAIPSEAASVLLVDHEAGDLYFQATRGPVAIEVKQYRVPLGTGIAGSVAQDHRAFSVSDVSKEPRFYREISQSLGFKVRSVLAVPIIHQADTHGVIELLNKLENNVFSAHEVENVEMVARAAGSLLSIARRLSAPVAAIAAERS